MQTYVQKQNEVREDALRALFEALVPLKKFVNKNNNYYEERTNIEQKALHVIADIRAAIHDLQYYDPLREREMCGRDNKAKLFCFNIPGESRNITYCPENFWPDDFMRCWKLQDVSTLRYKDTWFRVGDDFYKKDDYFLHNGVVYSKKEYALNKNNELVSLKESIPVTADFYNYSCNGTIEFNDWLTPKDVEMQQVEDYDYLIKLSICINKPGRGYKSSLFNRNYWLSMFKFGDKRYSQRKEDHYVKNELYFSEEMLRKIELAPSKDHLRIWQAVKEMADECIENDNQHRYYWPLLGEQGVGIHWSLTFNRNKIRTASIRDKIIRNLADGCYITTDELKRRLELIKDILNTEAQYVKAK